MDADSIPRYHRVIPAHNFVARPVTIPGSSARTFGPITCGRAILSVANLNRFSRTCARRGNQSGYPGGRGISRDPRFLASDFSWSPPRPRSAAHKHRKPLERLRNTGLASATLARHSAGIGPMVNWKLVVVQHISASHTLLPGI